MPDITDSLINRELESYGVSATAEICSAILAFIPLLLHWNRRIPLTTVTNPIEIVRFHFGESMLAASTMHKKYGRLADVGSGAGFPGIPLKLLLPELDLVLIESNAKKAAFLSEAARELRIGRVDVYRGRFEDFKLNDLKFDYIAARALGVHEKFVNWSRDAISADGSILLWLGGEDCLRVAAAKDWQWSRPLLIPRALRRTILVGTPA